MNPANTYLIMIAVIACAAAAPATISACKTTLPEPTVEQKQTAAGVKYGTQLVACAKDYSTPETIDACADDVRRRWGKDAGQ